ncbi:MAG: HD domain-containing protein [Deltaproteobacteria bacterium]|nr:HD domain-containing protein [Deltaproteobacteria bacterium]MBN2674066.1 HD domain-containing protein [Deltaproteobacteria bacterium]
MQTGQIIIGNRKDTPSNAIFIPFSGAVALSQAPQTTEQRITDLVSFVHKQTGPNYSAQEIVASLLFQLDFHSTHTGSHSRKVASASYALFSAFENNEFRLNQLYTAALLHDVGKLAVSTQILEKKSKLTSAERKYIQNHPIFTEIILAAFPIFDPIRKWAAMHHEHLNGTGYPYGRMRNKIPFEARIITVADIFVALTEDRPYRRGLAASTAIHKLHTLANEDILDSKIVKIASETLLS